MRRTIFDRARSFVLATWVAAVAMLALAAAPTTAQAQLEEDSDYYGITEFEVLRSAPDIDLGVEARNAVHTELGKTKSVRLDDSVARQLTDLGLSVPLNRGSDVNRLGTAIEAAYLVTGTVSDWKVESSKGGKSARVLIGVTVWDVAAGLKVNGAAVQGDSGVRPDDSSSQVLLAGAIKAAAYKAVQDIERRILPKGSVLSTLETTAYVNQGERSGFVRDQRVIFRRKKEQVAEGIVKSTDPESCFVTITRQTKGVRPGDKVSAIFVPPVPSGFGDGDKPRVTRRSEGSGNLSGLFQVVLLVGLLGLLLGQGRASNTDLVQNVVAEADLDNLGQPRVRLSWVPDVFIRGNNESAPVQWQVWRNGEVTAPVISLLDGNARNGYDDAVLSSYNSTFTPRDATNGSPSSGSCPAFSGTAGTGGAPTTFVAPGVPYTYRAEVVYKISGLSLPKPVGGFCFFLSSPVSSVGQATPLAKSNLQNPNDGVTVAGATSFRFTSVRGGNTAAPLAYAVQMSSSPIFAPGSQTVTFDQEGIGTPAYVVQDTATANGQALATPGIPFQTSFPGVKTLYWRVGVRNIQDNPGPVRDSLSGQRYIFSDARIIKTV